MKPSAISPAVQVSLLLLLGLLWFVQLGYRDLKDPDEGRYAEIPYEMFVSGDWLTPRLNGFKYLEKPPLQYWGTAAFYKLFGVSNTTSRLWCATLGFLGVLWITWLGNRLFGTATGYFAGLALACSLLYSAMGHVNTLDMGLTFFLSVGMGALMLAQTKREDPPHVRRWMLLAWAALACATLSKGLIGLLLPTTSVILYSLWQRDFSLWRHLHIGKGILLFLLLTAPWFVAVSLQNPEFPAFFFIQEHFTRYTTDMHGHDDHLLYFIPVFLAATLPWLFQAIRALSKPEFLWRPVHGAFDPKRLMWVNIVFTLVFFSFSHSKLIPYILPAFPFLALLIGLRLARSADLTWDAIIMAIVTLLLVAVGIFMVPYLNNHRNSPEVLADYRIWVFTAAAIMAISLITIYTIAGDFVEKGKKNYRCCRGTQAATLLATGSLVAFQLLGWGYQAVNGVHSTQQMVEAITPYMDTKQADNTKQSHDTKQTNNTDTPIYCVQCFYHSLPFYRQGTIQIVGYRGELELGIHQEPGKWIADFPAFLTQWQENPQAVAILKREDVATWEKQGMRLQTIYEDVARIAVIHPQ